MILMGTRVLASCLFAVVWRSLPALAAPPDFAVPPVVSTVVVPSPDVINNAVNPLGPTSNHFINSARYYGAGDLRGVGLNDLVYTPSYYEWQPKLPLQIWANLGNGRFEERTAAMIDGEIPLVGVANNVFVHDFNNDGRADIFVVDQGLEDKDENTTGTDGGTNILLLSGTDGKLHNRSGELPDNVPHFNHVSTMSDVNGDGQQDIVLTRLGGPARQGGVMFLFGDGQGHFTKSTSGLPNGVAYPVAYSNPSRHNAGSATVCDLDGDGRGDLVSASYGADADLGNWILVHQQQADGSFVERARLPMAAAVAVVTRTNNDLLKLGGHQLLCGKLAGGSRNDIMVAWEGSNLSYAQMMRNDGAFQFTDITVAALGSYRTGYTNLGGVYFAIATTELMDFDEDGDTDLVFHALGTDAGAYAGAGGFVYLNDGAGHFTPFRLSSGGQQLNQAEVIERAFGGCSSCTYVNLVFDAGGSKKKDIVLLNGFNRTSGPRFRNQSMSIRTLFNGEPNPVAVPVLKAPSVFSTAQTASLSFLRFFNTGTTAGSVTVTVNDGVTGGLLGLWDSGSLPAGSERQFAMSTIESALGISTKKPSYYALTMQSSVSGYFQHVLFRPIDGTLTNLSTCALGVTADPDKLSGVHSSTVGALGYPSVVAISNTGAASAPVTLGVYNATDGSKLGIYTSAVIPANGQVVLTMGSIESGAGITPSGSIGHYVIKAEGSFTGFLQHLVDNQKAGVTTDMTTACALNATSPPTTTAALKAGAIFSTAQTQSQSFLRFFNTSAKGGTVTATMRNYLTGQSVGTWTSPNIPPGAELQYAIGTVEGSLTVGTTKPAYYTLSLASQIGGYFQHVLFRPIDGTLTNLSTCALGVTADPDKLSGVHSTLLTAFPSTVVARNTSDKFSAVFLTVRDARTGDNLGTYASPLVAPYAQLTIPVATIEAGIKLTPSAGMFHYVINRVGPFTGFLQHLVTNNQVGVVTDMTTACTMAVN